MNKPYETGKSLPGEPGDITVEVREKQENHLGLARKRYAEMAGRGFMFADEEIEEDEEDFSISMERLEENGDLLDSYQTDTGNVFSGDSEKRLYHYRSKYYVIDCTHLDCFEYDDYDLARKEGGFN
jgi:hypothetical protein